MGTEEAAAVGPEDGHPGRCPKCRVGTVVRVEHQAGAHRSYDRFFCPRCGSSVEVFGGEPGPRAVEG